MDAPDTKSLPANAYTPLASGEVYAPLVPRRCPRTRGHRSFRLLGPPPLR